MPNTILYISYFGKTKISSNQQLIKHASYDKVQPIYNTSKSFYASFNPG